MRCGESDHGLRRRRLTRRAFWRIYGRLEHERLEFKLSVHHICESVVAMAMTSGGTILVGIGGTYLSVAQSSGFNNNMSAGRGYIALAALIFAKWRPWPALLVCLLFCPTC